MSVKGIYFGCCYCLWFRRRRTHGFSAFLSTPLAGGEIIFPKVKALSAAGKADAPLYAGSDDELRDNFFEICSDLPITHTDLQDCDELVEDCPEKAIAYDMLKITPRKGDALLFMPVRAPRLSSSGLELFSPSLCEITVVSDAPVART